MSTLVLIIGFFALVLVGILPFIYAILNLIKGLQTRREQEALAKFAGKKILASVPNANFFGQELSGYAQVRGNGMLIITEDEIYFEMWLPRREYHLPVSSIESVEIANSQLGKTRGRPLFKVNFLNEQGQRDSMAWLVPDPVYLQKLLTDQLSAP